MILDTTVLIDLQREFRRQQPGAASRLLEGAANAPMFVAFVTWMEFAEGFGDDDRLECERFLSVFPVLWPDTDTAWLAARTSRSLRAAGDPIGDHDLWISALALQHGRSVVSRNERHFKRVPRLSLRIY
jgi:predicted nucleic acid-binding protein